ncbi:MAG: hypothetical protein HKO92_08110, partial [Flavobacteriaceae bacterium]|nr:hypothetical protein [Flavobacteriaceae bacterium]
MAKDKKNTIKTEQSTNHFLKNEKDKRELAQEHKDFLGMSIPDKYFTKSKNSILNSLPTEQKQNNNIFKLKPFIAYPIAASFIILISVFIW